jgi:hypothetical protein
MKMWGADTSSDWRLSFKWDGIIPAFHFLYLTPWCQVPETLSTEIDTGTVVLDAAGDLGEKALAK